jgi:hypothetical protein
MGGGGVSILQNLLTVIDNIAVGAKAGKEREFVATIRELVEPYKTTKLSQQAKPDGRFTARYSAHTEPETINHLLGYLVTHYGISAEDRSRK